MSETNIFRVNGPLNTVNDAVVGTTGSPNGGPVRSHFAGQLGKWADFGDEEVLFDPNVGTLYGGRYQYVRLAPGASVPAKGAVLYWDATAAPGTFQVTTASTAAALRAGISINPAVTPGNNTIIQALGLAYVQFKATLTAAGVAGSPVYEAAGVGDVLTTTGTAALDATSLGVAYDAPTNGGLTRVFVTDSVRNR